MKKTATALVLLCAAVGGSAYALDLARATDLTTGFVTAGSLWVRYAAIGLVLLLMALAGWALIPKRPEPARRRSPLLAFWMLLCGMAFAAAGGAGLLEYLHTPGIPKIHSILQLFTAIWFLLAAASRLGRVPGPPAGSVAWGILGSLSIYLLTVMRFGFKPSGLVRVAPTVQVFSALLALVFVSSLLRRLYLPRAACGRGLYFCGCAAFFLCTCLELPLTLAFLRAGLLTPAELLTSLALALVGVLGGACALALANRPEVPEEPEDAEESEPLKRSNTSDTTGEIRF